MIDRTGASGNPDGGNSEQHSSDLKPRPSCQRDEDDFKETLQGQTVVPTAATQQSIVPDEFANDPSLADQQTPGIFDVRSSLFACPSEVDQGLTTDESLIAAASGTGTEAENAFLELVDQVNSNNVESAKRVAYNHIARGADSIEMLAFIAAHESEAAPIAVTGLEQLVRDNNLYSESACNELIKLVDLNDAHSKNAVRNLLLENRELVINTVVMQSDDTSDGMIEILNGLADIGDVGITVLSDLANQGFDFAMDGFGPVSGAISGTNTPM